MRNLGIIIALAGILIVAGALTFTPIIKYNLVDSNSGLDASAAIFFGGIIIFGVGTVILANALDKSRVKA
jgi:hypothetical protein